MTARRILPSSFPFRQTCMVRESTFAFLNRHYYFLGDIIDVNGQLETHMQALRRQPTAVEVRTCRRACMHAYFAPNNSGRTETLVNSRVVSHKASNRGSTIYRHAGTRDITVCCVTEIVAIPSPWRRGFVCSVATVCVKTFTTAVLCVLMADLYSGRLLIRSSPRLARICQRRPFTHQRSLVESFNEGLVFFKLERAFNDEALLWTRLHKLFPFFRCFEHGDCCRVGRDLVHILEVATSNSLSAWPSPMAHQVTVAAAGHARAAHLPRDVVPHVRELFTASWDDASFSFEFKIQQ